MRKALQLTMFTLCLAALAGYAQARTTCPAGGNTTDTVYDTDFNAVPLDMQSDDFQGPLGSATYSVADPNVGTSIYCGAFFLDLYSQSTRTLFINIANPIDGSQPVAPPAGYYSQYGELANKCSDSSGNTVYLQSIIGSSTQCRLSLDFGYGGTKYKITMGQAGTGLVFVTCDSVVNGQCTAWTFTPAATGSSTNPATVAQLSYYGRGGKLVNVGLYYFTFRYHAAL